MIAVIVLVLLALLGAVVTFAVVFLVDLLVAQIAGYSAGGVSSAVLAAVVAGLIGLILALRGRGAVAAPIGFTWGLAWIAVARTTGAPESVTTATSSPARTRSSSCGTRPVSLCS